MFQRRSSSLVTRHAAAVNDDARKLLEQARKIRQDIAAMEGKTVMQVEQEALQKKQLEQKRLEAIKQESEKEETSGEPVKNAGRYLEVPRTGEEMVRQAARAIERAYKDGGLTRQTVRLALLKENQGMNQEQEWPGGAQQMYREAAKPLTRDLLREVRLEEKQPLPPIVKDQDVWDFDGSGIVSAESKSGPEHDVQALVFANTDLKYVQDIQEMDKAMGENRLLLLVNPFWSNVDSWGFNILAPNAKKKAQEVIFDVGYNETYVLQRFSARGEQCVAIKAYPYDWQLFAFREDDDYRFTGHETAIRLGSSEKEPNSTMFADLLNERPEFKLSRNMRQMKNMF